MVAIYARQSVFKLESEKALVPVEDSKKVNDLKIKMVEVQQRIDALTESIASLSVKVIAEVNKKIEQEIEKKDSLAAELEEALREQRRGWGYTSNYEIIGNICWFSFIYLPLLHTRLTCMMR
ncbi:hypothetical protein [uncultured Oscillibacter sp.]|uniref:hypothetical protein n=1 Tax=uncultured Oscillibacter sp. TaxID=876091 RepID=UPI00260C1EEA|nr:hypothetical protein [uncultured Oscillibacter sp.]